MANVAVARFVYFQVGLFPVAEHADAGTLTINKHAGTKKNELSEIRPGRKNGMNTVIPVDAELGRVGKVGTELQEERAEVRIDAIKVVVIYGHLKWLILVL